jgi:putative DNA primase/helicase
MPENDGGWTPHHVFNDGKTGEDVCDWFAEGCTGDAYLKRLKERLRPGPPVIHAKRNGQGKKKKPVKKAEFKSKEAAEAWQAALSHEHAGNVTPLRQPEPDPEPLGVPPEFSEDGLAEQFTTKYADTMLYCAPAKSWYAWNGHRWERDETGLAIDYARRICKRAGAEVMTRVELGPKREKISEKIATRRVFANVEAIARTDRRHVCLPTKFDSRLWLLNTPGGVVDLRTGQLRPARKEDFCTHSTQATPDGKSHCPRWLQFLDEATDSDEALIGYLQRIAGYCLTGSVAEQNFFFIFGEGGAGKGTYANTLDWLLGSYSKVAPMDTFLETKQARHTEELAFLQGARLVTAQELDPGAKWNESRLKSLTGGDPITARQLYESSFTFYPTFKLMFAGNNKPILKNVDEAMRRRMYLIPFEIKVPAEKRDSQLQKYLREVEGGGILQWAIEGCLEWQKNGLQPPKRVMLATGEYFEEEDRIGAFFREKCQQGAGLRVLTTVLYNRYREWCDYNGEFPVSRKRFLAAIAQKGFKSQQIGGCMVVLGVKVKS